MIPESLAAQLRVFAAWLLVLSAKIEPNQRHYYKRTNGISLQAAGEKLGVTRSHLSRVLSGRRSSKRLLRAYRDLLRSEKSAPT